jgi:hypothetical protein
MAGSAEGKPAAAKHGLPFSIHVSCVQSRARKGRHYLKKYRTFWTFSCEYVLVGGPDCTSFFSCKPFML